MTEKNAEEYRIYLKSLSAEEANRITATHANMTLIHFIADFRICVKEKIDLTFNEAKRLRLDPNTQDLPWNNTPLMNIIAYEQVEHISLFLEAAKKNGFIINLNLRDKEDKTALLFAILLGWTPSSIIKSLITPINYNMADRRHLTPIMAACALRRLDVVKLLIEFGLGVSLEKEKRSEVEEAKLKDFISQVHKDSGKSLVHFSVLRAGVLEDQQKENYIETVLNLLKIAKIDGFRDLNARSNAISLPGFGIPIRQGQTPVTRSNLNKDKDKVSINKATFTHICVSNGEDFSGKAYLSSSSNVFLIGAKSSIYRSLYINIFESYAGKTLVESIMSGTSELLEFLLLLGCDFELEQNNGKTAKTYIDGLTEDKKNVSNLDITCLRPLSKSLFENINRSYCCSFFKNYGFKNETAELIISYAYLSPRSG